MGNLLIDRDPFGFVCVSERLQLVRECIKERKIIEIEYHSETQENYHEKIEPHLLILQKGEWFCYAFCRNKRDFDLLRLNRMTFATRLDERFRIRPFDQSNVCNVKDSHQKIEIRFSIRPDFIEQAKNLFGLDTLHFIDKKCIADVLMIEDERLIGNILALGENVEVLSPLSIREKVKRAAFKLAKQYK